MSYNGYRLKIGGVIFPNNMIAKGTYSCVVNKRLAKSWTDANGRKHLNYYQNNEQAKITFSIRERNSADQALLKPLLMFEDELTVEYYDDLSGTYATGTFTLDRPTYSHKTVSASQGIIYNATKITLTEL